MIELSVVQVWEHDALRVEGDVPEKGGAVGCCEKGVNRRVAWMVAMEWRLVEMRREAEVCTSFESGLLRKRMGIVFVADSWLFLCEGGIPSRSHGYPRVNGIVV